MNTEIVLAYEPTHIGITNIVKSFMFGLLKNNINCKIINRECSNKYKNNLWIITISDIKLYYTKKFKLPKYYIILQTESLKLFKPLKNNINKYFKCCEESLLILEYNNHNMKLIKNRKLSYIPFYFNFTGYYEIYYKCCNNKENKTIDILFYGSNSTRRKHIFRKIIDMKNPIECYNDIKQHNEKKRHELCAKSKIIMSINADHINNFNYARNIPLIETKQFVLFEDIGDTENIRKMKEHGLVFSKHKNYVKDCVKYCNDQKERNRLIELNYNYFKKNFHFDDFIKKVDILNTIDKKHYTDLIIKPLKYSLNDNKIEIIDDIAFIKLITDINILDDNIKFKFIVNCKNKGKCKIKNKEYDLDIGENIIIDDYDNISFIVIDCVIIDASFNLLT